MARKVTAPGVDGEAVKVRLQGFWAPGPENLDLGEVADLLRSCSDAQLQQIAAWLPPGDPSTTTGKRLVQLERVLAGALAERM